MNKKSGQAPLTGEASAAVAALKTGGNMFGAAYGTDSDDAASAHDTDTTDPSDARRDDSLMGDRDESVDESDVQLDEPGNDDMSEESDDYDLDDDADVRDDSTEEEDADVSASESADADASDDKQADTEEIEFTDDKGRRSYTIDYKDRAKIKQAFIQAAGMRKAFAERDAERAGRKKDQEALAPAKEKADQFDSLSSAWENEGIAGLVRVLSKGQQTWDQLWEAEDKHRKTLAAMSPEARVAHDARQAAAREAAEKARIQKQFDELKAENQRDRDATDRKTVEGYMESEFNRVRFHGKLGDKAAEHRLDTMLFETVKAQVMALPDDVEVTPQLVRKMYREYATTLGATIKKAVRKETGKVIEKKKVEATKHAQARMTSANRETTEDAEIRKDLKSGNTVSAVMKLLKRGGKQKRA